MVVRGLISRLEVRLTRLKVAYRGYKDSPPEILLSFFVTASGIVASLLADSIGSSTKTLLFFLFLAILSLLTTFSIYILRNGPFYGSVEWSSIGDDDKDRRLEHLGCVEMKESEARALLKPRFDEGVKEYGIKFRMSPNLTADVEREPGNSYYDRETRILKSDDVVLRTPLIPLSIQKESNENLEEVVNEVIIEDLQSGNTLSEIIIV